MEADFIHWLRGQLPGHEQLLIGPGDDAAIVRLTKHADIVVTSDLLTDGVDFLLDECGPTRAGRKSLAVNLSDLAAMACRPLGVVISLALPTRGAGQIARGLYEGLLPLAAKYNVALAGGDTNTWPQGLVICVTAFGETTANGSLTRSGAQIGDRILVTGSFGGSILGKHFDFEPRVNEALLLNERYDIHAAIDVSDGLSLDLSRLVEASGCGAVIAIDRIPIDEAARELAATPGDTSTALEHALSDGEDFELLLAVPEVSARKLLDQQPLPVTISDIGEFVESPGLWQHTDKGLTPVAARGFEHQ